MVGIVMGKQSLTAKYQQAIKAQKPLIDNINPRLKVDIIDRIGMAEPPGFTAPHRHSHRQAQLPQPAGKCLAQFRVGHIPPFFTGIAGQFGTEHSNAFGLNAGGIVLGL